MAESAKGMRHPAQGTVYTENMLAQAVHLPFESENGKADLVDPAGNGYGDNENADQQHCQVVIFYGQFTGLMGMPLPARKVFVSLMVYSP